MIDISCSKLEICSFHSWSLKWHLFALRIARPQTAGTNGHTAPTFVKGSIQETGAKDVLYISTPAIMIIHIIIIIFPRCLLSTTQRHVLYVYLIFFLSSVQEVFNRILRKSTNQHCDLGWCHLQEAVHWNSGHVVSSPNDHGWTDSGPPATERRAIGRQLKSEQICLIRLSSLKSLMIKVLDLVIGLLQYFQD